jgi:soluble lytic murein transglycosylase-like protein
VATGPASHDLVDLDRSFAESRRASVARRRARERVSGRARTAKLATAALAVSLVAGGIVAEAHGPAQRDAQAAAAMERCPIPRTFRRAFATASRETGIPLAVLTAVAYEESEMNPNARSRKGAVGLLQLMPGTARDLRADARDPTENVRAGAAYLAQMLTRFDGDLGVALAAYNAGPAAVERAGGAPSLETLAYVANVNDRAAALAGCR